MCVIRIRKEKTKIWSKKETGEKCEYTKIDLGERDCTGKKWMEVVKLSSILHRSSSVIVLNASLVIGVELLFLNPSSPNDS